MSKIVHLGKYYPPDMGGTEIITQSLAQAACDAGHEVSVVCFKQLSNGYTNDRSVSVQRYPISKIVSSQPISLGYIFASISAARKADIVHLHAPNLLAALAVLLMGSKPKLLVHWHTDVIGKGMIGNIIRPLEWLMLKRANVVVATSQRYAASSIPLKSFLTKVQVIPLGAPAPLIRDERLALPQRFAHFVGNRKLVLSVGRLSLYKGFSVLINAALHLPINVAIVIAGCGELAGELADLIVKKKLQDKVLLAGRVSEEELAALYQNADLFCLPSILRSEAFGVVLLEAMAHSLPIVATNIAGSGVSWVNEHGVSGLNTEPNNPETLAEVCLRILNDENLRSKFSNGARDRYLNNFTDVTFKNLSLALYDNISK